MGIRIVAAGASLARTTALAVILGSGAALAQQTDITIGMVLEPPNLDPTAGAAAAIDEVVYANIFEGLTRFAPDGSVVPGLAESWDISEDGLTYTFTLREGVTFHDGTAMTAEDVVFTLDRARAEDSTNAQKPLFAGIESVEAVDDTTVVVTLGAPDGAFPFQDGLGRCGDRRPRKRRNQRDDPRWHRTLPLRRMGAGRPGRDRAQRRLLGRARGAGGRDLPVHLGPQRRLRRADVGRCGRLPRTSPRRKRWASFEANPQFNVVVGSTEGETILAMNNAGEPLDDIRIRQAITPRDQPAGHHRRRHVSATARRSGRISRRTIPIMST